MAAIGSPQYSYNKTYINQSFTDDLLQFFSITNNTDSLCVQNISLG